MTTPAYGFVFAFALAVIHLAAGRITEDPRLSSLPVLSAAGGTTVAYVFVLILPEISEAVILVVEQPGASSGFLTRGTGAYAVVLFGFLIFYGVHAYVTTAQGEAPETSDAVFWVHMTSFAVYNGLIGYLLFHQETSGTVSLALYTVTMGLHFLVTDAGFRSHHGTVYRRVGQWVLAGSILVGAAVGYATEVHETLLALLFAFLAGGIVFNVLIEELPEVEWSRFGAFLAGVVVYTTLLLLR